ncbi:MAG: DUF1273 domain-containing protein [Oscillospiraceae bacterium]|jgi:uncharacterized phage-like protein YoqJ|nr:DUF1273 domain-containing protein [Oscillospiraceae bacterium]
MTTNCCFTGHRKLENPAVIQEITKREVIDLIKRGVTDYFAGGAVGFDTLSALLILDLKPEYPQIKLHLVLPCPPEAQTRNWNEKDKSVYYDILSKADEFITLSQTYYNGCMHSRNRYLVEHSQYCICYLTQAAGGTAYTVERARAKCIEVTNVAEKM